VDVEVVDHLAVSVQDPVDGIRPDRVSHPCRITSDQSPRVELVGVDEVAAQRFGIVGFVADVGKDEYAGFVHGEFRKRGD
jgi:hypothetical protein